MNSFRTIRMLSALAVVAACATSPSESPDLSVDLPADLPADLPPGMPIELPADTEVTVTITTQDVDYFQRTVIHWPTGAPFVCETSTVPGEGNTTPVTYGTTTYTTGAAGYATVEVFDRLDATYEWLPTHLMLTGGGRKVKAEGHPGPDPKKQNWTDTIVTFSW